MALSDRLRSKLADAAEKTKAVAADQAGTAVDKAKEALDARSGTAGPRLLALLRMDDEQPVTIEALVVLLVDAVRRDDEGRELTDRDVFKAARRRYRRLGMLSLPTGPVGWRVVSLYCEAATVCDIVQLRGEALGDEALAAHLLVLWDAMPDLASASAAIERTGPSVLQTLLARYSESVKERLPDPMTKRAVVTTIWQQRAAMSDVREAATPGVRENVFPGKRVKAFISRGAGPARRRARAVGIGGTSWPAGAVGEVWAHSTLDLPTPRSALRDAGVVSPSCRCRRTPRAADAL